MGFFFLLFLSDRKNNKSEKKIEETSELAIQRSLDGSTTLVYVGFVSTCALVLFCLFCEGIIKRCHIPVLEKVGFNFNL